jgi:hypothetical protein
MTRLDRVKAVVRGEAAPIRSPDPRQRPILYYPDLPTQPEYEASDFSWTGELRGAFESISAELDRCRSMRRGFEPVFPTYASGGRWASLWFMLYGARYEQNCAAFPRTMEAVAAIPRQAGWAAVSVLEPGAHIRPHCGVTNAKLRLHYALRADPGSCLRVADRQYEWAANEILIFDDSFEHEVWVGGASPRFVLIVDFYHPDLSPQEVSYLESLETEPSVVFEGKSLRARYQSGVAPKRVPGDVDWVYQMESPLATALTGSSELASPRPFAGAPRL